MIPAGTYRTEHGSTVRISGQHNGIAEAEFDWLEEPNACLDCQVNPYPEEFDTGVYNLVWNCECCGGGSAQLTTVEGTKP